MNLKRRSHIVLVVVKRDGLFSHSQITGKIETRKSTRMTGRRTEITRNSPSHRKIVMIKRDQTMKSVVSPFITTSQNHI